MAQIISTLADLDAKLAECDAALAISDDAMRSVFASFRMDVTTMLPPDPFSREYRDAQMAIYQRISGKSYCPANESTKFDVEAVKRRPFPYYTGSCATTGRQFMAMGFLLSSLNIPPGSRIVEFGPGWGNTTIALALVGFQLTAVDIERDFCDLIRLRAEQNSVDVSVVNADFMWAEQITEPYDAAIFFECFHHCSDHIRLMTALKTAVKPEGRIYFAAEPIVPDFAVPWGIRMDGESLWAVRRHGWMELGFSEAYFREALARTGWAVTKHVWPDIGWAAVWEARRSEQGDWPRLTCDAEAGLRAELAAVYRSTSWRLTAPLRALKR